MSVDIDLSKISEADQADIAELEDKIDRFGSGKMDEERFKLYRLTRGVYGQRQLGVQMFRIKIPYGKITPHQIERVADLSRQYASSNLHLTTRQDIQLHYVRLADSPAVWKGLTTAGLTGREACGNTVRNVTASPTAGIDPKEPFDITPYAHATAYYFLRNPICQEMGRKIKISFSSSYEDTAFGYFHDFGFIPVIKKIDGEAKKGFKVLVGGGLGAVAIVAQTAYEFLPVDEILPFMEAALRVFDRYGEREKRQKARMKFLVKSLGLEQFISLVNEERAALPQQKIKIDESILEIAKPVQFFQPKNDIILNEEKYNLWRKTNVFEQKQRGYFGVFIKVFLGDIKSDLARQFAPIAARYASNDIRITVDQNLLLKYVHPAHLPELFVALDSIGLAEPGFGTIADITACPGTDTCNLGVTNSTGLAGEIEKYITAEFPELIEDHSLSIKISGCMNACGQHMASNIGFHGSSIKKDNKVIPAMQVVIGGGLDPTGKGWIGQKVIKLPTKRILTAVGSLLNDFDANKSEGEYYNDYFTRLGKKHFYKLLKPLADIDTLGPTDFFDWGQDHQYNQEIGVGECAGVVVDVIGAIINDGLERLDKSRLNIDNGDYPDGIYYAYNALVIGAKAMLLSEDHKCNTQIKILSDFQELIIDAGKFNYEGDFKSDVLQMKTEQPTETFAKAYYEKAAGFMKGIIATRNDNEQKEVISSYYNA